MTRMFFAFGLGLVVTIAPATALDLPMTPSEIQAAIDYGANNSPSSIAADPTQQLGNGESASQPWGQIITPFSALAFASAEAHAKYQSVSNELLHETKAAKTFTIVADAFDTELPMNDDMAVVIKQSGRVIHPVSKDLHSDEEVISIDDNAGYRTSVDADFSYKTLNVRLPFTVVIANYGMRGQETDFAVDPTTFR